MKTTWRAALMTAATTAALVGMAACGTSPPMRWYELRIDAPVPARPTAAAGDTTVWEMSNTVALPGGLDRESLMVASANASLQPMAGQRWAEPLRDAVPRVLRHDLELLRGPGRVWAAPAPAGVQVQRQLRVEVLALQAQADRGRLRLLARWWLVDTAVGAQAVAPVPREAEIEVPMNDGSGDAIAAAHRLALWRLAERIAGVATP